MDHAPENRPLAGILSGSRWVSRDRSTRGVTLHVITSEHLDVAAALVVRDSTPVLVFREGLLQPPDLHLVQTLMACVCATTGALAS